jgi:dTDP-4-amino-4,6-dideoxygalactose transaminase
MESLCGAGGAVALPGWGCFDLVSAAVGAGVGVRLYDLDPETLQPERASLDRVVDDVDAVVLVSFFGIPVDPGVWAYRSPERCPALIHDAAQAHGAAFGRGSVDQLADVTVLSFGRGKGWTGLSGGALLARSDRGRAAVEARVGGFELTADGPGSIGMGVRGAAQWLLGRPSIYGLPARVPALGLGETRYHPPSPVAGLEPSSAAVLLAARTAADREALFRRERATTLLELLDGTARLRAVAVASPAASGFLRLPVLDLDGVDRRRARALGVLPSYPIPLSDLEPLKPLLRSADPTPGSARLAQSLLTLPTHSRVSAGDRIRLERWLADPSLAGR